MIKKISKDKKLLWGFIGILWLTFFIFGLINYILHKNNLIESAVQDLEEQTQVAAQTFVEWINARATVVNSLANEVAALPSEQRNSIPTSYFNRLAQTELFDFLGYALEDGFYNSNPWEIPKGYQPLNRPWYQETKSARKPIVTRPYIGVDDDITAYVAFTSPIQSQNEFLGVVTGDVVFSSIYNKVVNSQVDHKGVYHLVDGNGDFILEIPGQKKVNLIKQKMSSQVLNDILTNRDLVHYSNGNSIIVFHPISYNGWWLVSIVDKAHVLQPVYEELQRILFLFLLIAIATYALQKYYSYQIFSPIINQFKTDLQTSLPNKNSFLEGVQLLSNSELPSGLCILIEYNDMPTLLANYEREQISKIHQEIIQRVHQICGNHVIIGSVAHDQIAIFKPMQEIPMTNKVGKTLQKLDQSLNNSYWIDDIEIIIKLKIASSTLPLDGSSFDLLSKAQIALSTIQDDGLNYKSYRDHTRTRIAKEAQLVQALRQAINDDELQIMFQPVISYPDNSIQGLEVLSRWHSKAFGKMVSPLIFIKAAEQNNLIRSFSLWLTHSLFKQIETWKQQSIDFKKYSMNLSSHNLHDPIFVEELISLIGHYEIDPRLLEIEITEHVAIEHFPKQNNPLDRLRNLGVSIAVDDFGTGYSSLSYLKQLPINTIKIDRSFIKSLPTSQHDIALSKAIIDISKEFELNLIAEGVETKEQADFLLANGCTNMQGYYFAKPMLADQLEEQFLRNIKKA